MALAARQRHGVTADEFFAMADRLPPHAQLIDGEVIVSSPRFRHQNVVGELYHRLRLWIAESAGRGWCGLPLDVKVDDRNVYAPDLWWCSEAHRPGIDEIRLPVLPDLAVEVLSPSTRRYDLGAKRARYEQQGLPELWVIDPRPGAAVPVRILRRSAPGAEAFDVELTLGADGVLASPQLDGFSLAIADLLA
jgi:Uma2 family endonuclease